MNNAIANVTLIKAGAGAGKTYRIQQALAEWVTTNKVQANRILAVTFTNAAASEMRQRIKLALLQAGQTEQATQLQQAVITTIHSFGLDILQRFAFEQGLSPAPRQLSDSEQQYLLAHILSQLDSVVTLVDNADRFGYRETIGGKEYKDKHQAIQEEILKVINTLRSIGKDDPQTQVSVLAEAQEKLTALYGEASSAERLNTNLKIAIENGRNNLPEKNVLSELWGRGNQPFVEALFGIDVADIGKNWSHWVTLQTLGAPTKVYGTRNKPGDSDHITLVEAVMAAAQQLPRHPGPLQDALENLQNVITSAMAAIGKYQAAKRSAGLVDYTDMVGLAHQIMHNDSWLQELAGQFDCLIIDEFQDTNPLQYALLDKLHQQDVPVLIVGDLKQAIMGFQGADRRLFAGLLEQHKNTEGAVQELDKNWRSTEGLMQFINAIGTVLYGADYTPLTPQIKVTSGLTPVRILHFDRADWLAQPHAKSTKPVYTREGYQLLANEIVVLLQPDENGQTTQVIDKHSGQQRPIQPSDIAVLAKNKSKLKAFAKVLREQGINIQMQEEGFLECPLVCLLLDALQALNNRNDQFAWAALATSPILAENPVQALQDLLQSALANQQNANLPPWGKSFSHALKTDLPAVCKGVTKQPLAVQLQAIAQALNLLDVIKVFKDYEQYRANLLKLQQLASQFEQQDEQALLAMGIVGKNAATFAAWLQAMGSDSEADVNKQPLANPISTNAVVLTTWHSSKGLEWPVVMVLQAEDVPETRLPSIAVEYQPSDSSEESSAEHLLANSSLQILPSFTDKTSKQKMLAARQADTDLTANNLYYVALTRAREQLIIPVLEEEEKKDDKTGRMYQSILPVVHQLLQAKPEGIVSREKMEAEQNGVKQFALQTSSTNRCLSLQAAPVVKPLKHSVTPSKHHARTAALAANDEVQTRASDPALQGTANFNEGEQQQLQQEQHFARQQASEEQAEHEQQQLEQAQEYQQEQQALVDTVAQPGSVQQHRYQPACDLDALGYQGPANELGTWMHRLYQVYLLQPALLTRAMEMPPCNIKDPSQQQELQQHLQGFRTALETLCGGIETLRSEVPITGLNSKGQVISGVIDLLVEDRQGNCWIVDHKTDKEAVSKGYWEQLQTYRRILQKNRNVAGCVLNWTRHGEMSVWRGSGH
ncbi:hypothetical protein CBP31_06360 [Oceanisphaera profunda]|uniref:DNA 3'-5' helicase n=1 Tax=Oceanisphaera profunda TaxID=1416627 RepID=A0A1Y0D440_9GAMM|nr:UvrD-helicase domain-containing protein [Oceanisphaera profunda]ART82293.1 hypothetical protein CBP31_06360 [Oceanisphaera profunda]